MKLNCRPGDLAVVIVDGPFLGMIVEVLYKAPMEPFNLPDGYPHVPGKENSWVIKMQRPIVLSLKYNSEKRMTIYACATDSVLRPIRDSDGEDETMSWAGKPDPIVTDKEIA